MKKTNRGFGIYAEFTDSYGQRVRVQHSSAACVDAVWIFASKDGESALIHLGKPQGYSPHLTVAQAKRVIRGLQKFVDHVKSRNRKHREEAGRE